MIRLIIFLSICVPLQSSLAVAQQPPMSLEKRIELAKKLLAVDRAAAIANPSESSRTNLFTETYASIDPKWTADFILNNPIKGQEGLLYENKTIRQLLKHPEELLEKQTQELVDYYPFMSSNYIRLALENLPVKPEHETLRKQLVQKAWHRLDEAGADTLVFQYFGPADGSHLPDNPELANRIKKNINEFFLSGKAEETWKTVSKQGPNPYMLARLKRLAPKGFDLSFLGKYAADSIVHGYELAQVLGDATLSREEKVSWLAKKNEYVYGSENHEIRISATNLGLMAKYDIEKSLAWAETADSPITRIVAKLSIAPALAKQNKERAIELVRVCYQDCLEIDPNLPINRGDQILLNTPPVQVASSGLRIAHHLDADLFDNCLQQTLQLIESDLEPTTEYDRIGRVYRALAHVARYDRKAAKDIFDRCSSEVQIGMAPEFFVALVAIDPESVWDEYSTLPQGTEQSDTAQYGYILRSIVPALVQREENEFWAKLDRSHYVDFPKSIFEQE